MGDPLDHCSQPLSRPGTHCARCSLLTPHPSPLTPHSLQAITASKTGDDSRVIMSLLQLAAILEAMPALDPASPEAELIAGELVKWADQGQRTNVLNVFGQISPAHTPLVARMLGCDDAAAAAAVAGGAQAGST